LEEKEKELEEKAGELREKDALAAKARKQAEKETEELKAELKKNEVLAAGLKRDNTLLEAKLDNTIKTRQKAVKEQARRLNEKEALISKAEKEAEKLKGELEKSKSLAAGLKQDNAALKTESEEFRKKLRSKEKELSKIERDAEHERTALLERSEELSQNILLFRKKNEMLEAEIGSVKEGFRGEKAVLYEQMGTALTQAGLYSRAIEAYVKSLSFDPANAQVHYNLGFLYEHAREDSERAVFHLQKYLTLNPHAQNRKDVEFLIGVIQGG
ncbi:MAG: hypothetical protein DRP85_04270, partial [Candidatus Makaraimicrobium thalassicum]